MLGDFTPDEIEEFCLFMKIYLKSVSIYLTMLHRQNRPYGWAKNSSFSLVIANRRSFLFLFCFVLMIYKKNSVIISLVGEGDCLPNSGGLCRPITAIRPSIKRRKKYEGSDKKIGSWPRKKHLPFEFYI